MGRANSESGSSTPPPVSQLDILLRRVQVASQRDRGLACVGRDYVLPPLHGDLGQAVVESPFARSVRRPTGAIIHQVEIESDPVWTLEGVSQADLGLVGREFRLLLVWVGRRE